jgi:hypothetical protein
MLKDKVNLIKALLEMETVENFEQKLEKSPLVESKVNQLPTGVRLPVMDYIKQLRDSGKIVPDPVQSLDEFKKENAGAFVISKSAVFQMEQEEYRQVRQAGLWQSTSVAVYPDVKNGEAVVHYNYIAKNGTQGRTGGIDMVNVIFKSLDQKESDMNHQLVVNADQYYKAARTQIEDLLRNLESIKAGQYNSQA